MTEILRSTIESTIQTEKENIHFLKKITNQPELFLEKQNALLYSKNLTRFHQKDDINKIGLPDSTNAFYQRKKITIPIITNKLPRILNIGSGSEASRKLAAINIDISPEGKPDVIADAQNLPFKKGIFTLVRASHILEHIDEALLEKTLTEWKRVLHENGELHIAVPDADVTFQEIIDGHTPKGKPSLSFIESTAPLAQIYGLGYNNIDTDKRWLHKIIFSFALLKHFLEKIAFTHIDKRKKSDDLASYCDIDDDSQNHYSLLVSARNERKPHYADQPLSEVDFHRKVTLFKKCNYIAPKSSFIIPVYNESKNLNQFLNSLEQVVNTIESEREFIFVINGCTDDSEMIIQNCAQRSKLNVRIVPSEKGILRAFMTGIERKNFNGYIGKLDADITIHPHTLDLLQIFLVENSHVQATYAEPVPIGEITVYNHAENQPSLRSERLYIHGRTALYRQNPFEQMTAVKMLHDLHVEDMFLSFYFAYFYGIDSIKRTPHALIYSKTIKNDVDLAKQISRSNSEMKRIFKMYPPFETVAKLLAREIYPSEYKTVFDHTFQTEQTNNTEWTRIENTK